MRDFIQNILSDLRVDLTDEFDRNFERKAFFDKPWESTKFPNHRGSLMMRTGKTRRSIRDKQTGTNISWSSSLPHANLMNEGGEVVVTERMKRFFWAMFYKSDGAITMKRDKGKNVVVRNTGRNKRLSAEAQMWRNLALQKVGSKMKIKQRQFIGDHPIVRQRIEHVVDLNFKELEKEIFNKLKQ
jgi:hypothetical protein